MITTSLTNKELQVYDALIANVESTARFDEDWGIVYLGNVLADIALTPRQFAGTLSSLTDKGLYKAGYKESAFGYVSLV